MESFELFQARDPASAVVASSGGRFLAGGTNLLDLMKMGVEKPKKLVDVGSLPLSKIEVIDGNRLRVGALVKNSDLAFHAEVLKRYPVLSEAILSGASPQLRNMASVGGNLLQRTRCVYFGDVVFACNKRNPGSGCPAIRGYNRNLAVLGTSEDCIASNPSDMNVALAAIDPVIHVLGKAGERTIAFGAFHLLPGHTPQIETSLQSGELITSIDLPDLPYARRSRYIKVRDRASYEFALVSAAVILDLSGDTIRSARLALGGVGTKPWRALDAEQVLTDARATPETFKAAAEAAMKNARSYGQNDFKIKLAKNLIERALTEAREMKL